MNDVLARSGILQGVPPGAADMLVRHLHEVSFRRRRTVFVEGERGDRLYIILSGKVKVHRKTSEGRETLIALLGPGDMFGELALFDPGPRTSTVTTLTELYAVAMDRHALHAWITAYPTIAEQLLQVLARRLRRTNDTLCDLILTDVPGRVAKQLLDLANRFGTRAEDSSVRVDSDLTQQELAQLVGASRETVNKVLSGFCQRGWIRQQAKIIYVIDPDRLARRAR